MVARCMKQTASWYCSVKLCFSEVDAGDSQQLQGFLERYFGLDATFFMNHSGCWRVWCFVFHWVVLQAQVRKQMRSRLCLPN